MFRQLASFEMIPFYAHPSVQARLFHPLSYPPVSVVFRRTVILCPTLLNKPKLLLWSTYEPYPYISTHLNNNCET